MPVIAKAHVRIARLALLALLASLPGCQAYRPLDDPDTSVRGFEVSGQALLELPIQETPVWVIFAVDCSGSMANRDPVGQDGLSGRTRAIRDFLDQHADRPDMRWGVIRFGSWPAILTQTDTNGDGVVDRFLQPDGSRLRAILDEIEDARGWTDFHLGLDLSIEALREELRLTESAAEVQLKVQVIFVSDDGEQPIQPEDHEGMADLEAKVQRLTTLGGPDSQAEVRLHTFQITPLESTGDLVPIPNREVLKRMAQVGGGAYHKVTNPDGMTYAYVDVSPVERRQLPGPVRVLAANLNALPGPAGPEPDSDSDGLADETEIQTGTDPLAADSDGDGYADGVERRLGPPFDPMVPNPCPAPSDADGDGLPACAEVHLGTDATRVDTDGDGLPDSLELWAGSDPLSANAAPPTGIYEAAVERTPQADGLIERIEFRIPDLPLGSSQSGDDTLQIWLGGPELSYRMACLAVPPAPRDLEIALDDSDFGPPGVCP